MSAQKVDVLAWFDDYIRRCGAYDDGTPIRAAVAALIDATKELIPHNLCLGNPNVLDSTEVDLIATMGELRSLAAALANIGSAP